MGWLKKFEGARLAVAGLIVAAVLFLAVNVLASNLFRGTQADFTEGNLYTLSEGTKKVMGALSEPIYLRLYFSRPLGEVAPRYGAYYDRVHELLERYVGLANGHLSLQLLEPEPFSDAEDRAVADGLQGVPLNQAGEMGYFGLVGSNSIDGRTVVPFFNLEREPFLEYDLTKLIHGLSGSERPVLGLLSTLPTASSMRMPQGGPPPLTLFDQIREFFSVEDVATDEAAVPTSVKTLMVVDLKQLSADTLRAVDRFVHAGGPALVFVDALVESAQPFSAPDEQAAPAEDVTKLLRAWGLELVDGKVAGDIDAARRVSTGERGGIVGDYVAWMTLSRNNVDVNDPVLANVERLNLATSAILQPVDDSGMKVTPLIFTGPRAATVNIDQVRMTPDIMGILRSYKPGGKPLMLAARVSGEAPLAFAEGEGGLGNAAERKPIQVIVVADADMLYDRFWLQSSDFFGQRVDVPTASNADFVINALENLADAGALVGLRGRGTSYRPFSLVEDLRRDAEAQYREKEQALQGQLKELQQKLQDIQQRGDASGGQAMLSAEDKQAIERFRADIVKVRKDLRDVQHALRRDIERLEQRVKFANVAAVPLVLGGIGGGVALFRRIRRGRVKQQGGQG